jgi:hypothetical protein
MTLWPHLVQMPWAKPLIVLGAFLLLLGLCMACWLQTPPQHPFHQWERKLTGESGDKSPLGSTRFSL